MRCPRQIFLLAMLAMLALTLLPLGCSRRQHRLRADADAYALINEKSIGTPWQLPRGYSIYPDPNSRLADPTDPDYPLLPSPGPILYSGATPPSLTPAESLPVPDDEALPEPKAIEPPEPPEWQESTASLKRLPKLVMQPMAADTAVQLANYQVPSVKEADQDAAAVVELPEYGEPAARLAIQPVPSDAWNVLPPSSLQHMLEFESVRREYEQSFRGGRVERPERRRLNLRQLVDLAVRNSREYQTAEEVLYVAALNVSLQRYDYQLKFSPTGNGIDVNYSHARANDQTTLNRLSLPSSLGLEKMFAAGGTLVTQFANEVILDFNGGQGVTSRISSDLLFGFTQSILQRDVLLDPLIQSERDLVYAARDFARFRKAFFFDIAEAYYGLLSTYRSVEIDSQNYFSLVRTVEQARSEVRAGVKTAPNQVAVDQFEQSMLSGRSALIATTNELERELDQLKLTLGLPTDLPLDIDLSELERLTRLDEVEVAMERVSRWRERVEEQLRRLPIQRADLVNADIFMIERLLEWVELQESVEREVPDLNEIRAIYERLQLEQAHNEVERNASAYEEVTADQLREPTILVFLRATVLLSARLQLIDRQLQILQDDGPDDAALIAAARPRWADAEQALRTARGTLEQNPSDEQLAATLTGLQPVLDDMRELSAELDRELQFNPNQPADVKDQQAVADTQRLIELSDEIIGAADAGLPEVNIDVNDAVLTALIQRLDLMNERGFLADQWRRIKFAADDLRSILNLSAQHRLSTTNDELPLNPLEFDVDQTNTDLRLSLDLPLNRRAQRNAYRRALIAFQRARRDLMQLEDAIKFDIRNGLRTVELVRMQYPIRVTQAALAAEQVISIRLQLALGTPNVRGTDLLDALQGSREALTEVANLRINDLVNRTQFVLNMELMQLDEDGFWPAIDDPNYQPEANLLYPLAAGPTYGEIPRIVKPSPILYHIYCYPRPGERIEQITTAERSAESGEPGAGSGR